MKPVNVETGHGSDWIVPRRVMCAFFWVGIVLLFTGIILLVTSKHKEEFYQSWGAILLGLGFCLLLICFILCLHAYCVITVSDDEIPNSRRQTQSQTALGPAGFRQRAPLKEPPNFKIPSGSTQQHPARLKTISENGSSRSSNLRTDHIRPANCARITSLPPLAPNARPPSVKSRDHGNNGDESGYENSTGEASITDSNPRAESADQENSDIGETVASNASGSRAAEVVPMAIIRDKRRNSEQRSESTAPDFQDRPPEVRISTDHRPSLSLSIASSSSTPTSSPASTSSSVSSPSVSSPASSSASFLGQMVGAESANVHSAGDDIFSELENNLDPLVDNSYVGADNHVVSAAYRQPVASARPLSARVTVLPSNREPRFVNGLPAQVTYTRQYPISSVHAYPTRPRHNPYTPLRVRVDSPGDAGTPDGAGVAFRPMPAILESEDNARRQREDMIIRPFDRSSNLLSVQSSGLMDGGLTNSANIYLTADQTDSKMSIYDNLNYIRI